jgi:DHA1 family multidrug resistance protein-like MFS transporter
VLIAAFVSILGFNLAFPFLPLYVQSLGVTDPGRAAFWSGVLGSVAGVIGAVIAPIWGQLADRSGRRPMLIRATAGAAVGLVLMGLAPGLLVLLLGRIVFGLMAGTMPAANPLIAANTPPAHLAAAMGVLQSSVYVANATGPIIGGVLASTVGYRATFLVTAVLYVASALPVYLVVREQFTRPQAQTPLVSGMAANFRMVFSRRDLVLPIFAALLAYAAYNVLTPVLPLQIAHLVGGNDPERAAGLAFGAQGGAGTVAALTVGSITRRLGYRPLLIGVPPMIVMVYLGLLAAPSFAVMLALLTMLGMLQALTVTVLTSLLALRAPRESAGVTFGVVSSVNSLAFSGAPFFGGLIASLFGLRAPFPLAALLALAMLVLCLSVLREPTPTSNGLTGLATSQERPAR